MPTKQINLPTPHSKQAEILSTRARFSVICCGRRFGKNILSHRVVVNELLKGYPVAWGSPTYKNLADDWRTLQEVLAPITPPGGKSEQERRIDTLIRGGILEMWSLDNPEPIRGRRYKLFVINEAASVPNLGDTFSKIIRPTLVDFKGEGLFPSTPAGRNDYYKMHLWGVDPTMKDWAYYHYTSYDNPFLDPAELDIMRREMTELEYRQEILAEFIEGEGTVFRKIALSTLAPVTSPWEHPEHTLVAGVDWGKQDDFTAISIGCVDCQREVELDRFNQIDYSFQTMRLMNLCHKWKVTLVHAEKNSMGDPLIERLQRMGLRVKAFQTTRVSKAPLIEGFSLALENSEIQLLDVPYATGELEAYERQILETTTKYGAPEGLHDDTVIARALMYDGMRFAPRYKGRNRRQKNKERSEALRAI